MTDPDHGQHRRDIRPSVAMRANNRTIWLFGAGLSLGAVLLFHALESRRNTTATPTTAMTEGVAGPMIVAPPDLVMPAQDRLPLYNEGLERGASASQPQGNTLPSGKGVSPAPLLPGFTPPVTAATGPVSPPAYEAPTSAQQPQVVYDAPSSRVPAPEEQEADAGKKGEERVRAGRFVNPATTVPKGTVIQAVLETALDSTRPGFARAIVSRDVFGFDGSRVLIPKGSRLIGEYKADLASGQKRALIQWQRLMRPDGVVINIDSPAADPLGRAGVKGDVDTHFLERFSGAILQSALDVGVQIAARRATRDTVIVALPGSTQGIVGATPEKIQPTLKVKQGASVSVFVARDLDFTSVGS